MHILISIGLYDTPKWGKQKELIAVVRLDFIDDYMMLISTYLKMVIITYIFFW
jgi:hypothetical protein